MLKQSKVDELRNGWNEKAAELFVASATESDLQKQSRMRGSAETLTTCAAELKKASAED